MKRLIIFLGIVLLFGVITTPLSAQGRRNKGFGPHMGYGPGPDIDPRMGGFFMRPGFSPLTEDQRTQLEALNKRFQEETTEYREALFDKSRELNTALNSEKPDEKKARALQKEINDLQAKLAEKRLDFRLETTKIIPESDPGRGLGRGLGVDPQMLGFPKRPGLNPLTEEQRNQLKELNKKFREETDELREDLSSTSRELRGILDSEKPDEKKAKALQKEINNLRAELSQKTLDLRLEVRKILPETEIEHTRGLFRGGRGFGPHMGRDRGMGRAPGFF